MTAAAASSPRVLLLGGHGKVSLLLTPLLLARSWHVTSLIRNSNKSEQHENEIRDIAKEHGYPAAQLDVINDESLEDVKSEKDALRVLERTKPDYVVWSAGESHIFTILLRLSRLSKKSKILIDIAGQFTLTHLPCFTQFWLSRSRR